ncbi:hypothetical protein VNO77_03504 [Canavalia gladiata]|uniref:Uncharacterized protein n=1 Tax=Canavalia gladiata TaxID=3824 RepID=A0AAN9MUU9_CANGL
MGIFNVMEGLVLASECVMDDNARSTPTTLISTPNWLLGSLDGTTWVGKDQLVSRLIQLLLSAFIMGCCFAQLPSCSDAHIKVNQDSLFIEYYIETNLNQEFHTRTDSSYGIVLFKNKECVAKG